MNVVYTATTRALLDQLPISNGQIIALIDEASYYYDMNNQRHVISGLRVVDTLPDRGETGCIYLSMDSTPYKLYVWNAADEEFIYVGGQYNAGVGLSISGDFIKANLLDDSVLDNDAQDVTELPERLYPVRIDHSGHLAVVVPWADTTYTNVSKLGPGLCPQLPDEDDTDKFLREDGIWMAPPAATTYASLPPDKDGPFLSLVTTGDKYNWNSKAAGNHTHPLSIEEGLASYMTLQLGTKYTLTAGGSSFAFRTPSLGEMAVTGVKGDAESTYRTGQVNITSQDIGITPQDIGTIPIQTVTGTLAAGSTSMIISNSLITTSSTVLAVCADDPKLSYKDILVETGSVTLTFSAQSAAKNIKVFIV